MREEAEKREYEEYLQLKTAFQVDEEGIGREETENVSRQHEPPSYQNQNSFYLTQFVQTCSYITNVHTHTYRIIHIHIYIYIYIYIYILYSYKHIHTCIYIYCNIHINTHMYVICIYIRYHFIHIYHVGFLPVGNLWVPQKKIRLDNSGTM